VTINPIE